MLKINNKPKTKTLKTIKLDNNHLVTIEKILTGRLKNRYYVKSYHTSIWGQKETSLSAHNISLDNNSNSIKSIEYKGFTFLSDAVSFLDFTIKHTYPNWIKRQ